MDTKRFSTDEHYRYLFDLYRIKYQNINIDLVISSDNNAFNFLKKHNGELFNTAPVVFCGVNNLQQSDVMGFTNFTGVNELANIRENFLMIKRFQPRVKNIYIVIDSTTTGKVLTKQVNNIVSDFKDGIKYEIITNVTLEELTEKAKNFSKDSAILLTVFFKGRTGEFYEYYESSLALSEYSEVPLYGLWDFNFENGIIGGYLTSGLFQGKEAALMGIEILNGKYIKDIPIKYKSPNHYMFDYEKLTKYGLDPSVIPLQSYIINQPVSMFELYKQEIISVIVLFVFCIFIMILQMFNIKRINLVKKRVEENLTFQQTLINTVDTPIYFKNTKGVYKGCNKALEDFFSRPSSEIIGKTTDEIIEDQGIHTNMDKELLRNGKSLQYEGSDIDHDGDERHLVFYKNAFYNQDDEISGLVGSIFNVTQLKNISEELRILNQDLEQQVLSRTRELNLAKDQIEDAFKQTNDSIKYASLIQHAIIPSDDVFQRYFSDHFALWLPKDVIGGDIYLFEELRTSNECLLMVVDCTGHGVPGAFVTMLVKAVERQIIAKIFSDPSLEVSPAWMLSYFNKTIKTLLRQDCEDGTSNAGFDAAIVYYNKENNTFKYAGAVIPLFYVEEGEMNIIKGDRHSVGYRKSDSNYVFTEHTIEVKEGMQFYLSTDGYVDQNGGEKGFPLGKKQFKKTIMDNLDQSMTIQREALIEQLRVYQNSESRTDDITIVAVKI
ncbi:SpoIIE family protein phosphatase [Vibrio sp. Of7-15]|uniref:ABC transporter substrate binding protein n=1 Tax=Vibrio sp. Of7-15 TaxID=2724879 RepID=UPI001EF171E4|nr:ABC transporter substrate binding protein [Vibrio sp. Of7-15]MCG7495378.1 SpoIIE family protein phosphatase [Vibrio sp. Of7-15]